MEPLPASFYGDIDSKNPVISTFENEVREFLGFMRKLQRAPPGEAHQQDHRRGSSTLFNIWVKYKPRLPEWYYQEKLLKVGDSLAQIREYKLALFQCYGRYLEQFCSLDIDHISDVEQFKATFFPNGTDDEKAGLMFHALQGRCICMYQLVKISDASLRDPESVKKCLKILYFLQLIMQVVLPQEHLCWLIFNGSLHIYTICRHLMALGRSSQALEFLLWACVCIESSVPLLSVHYLTWRATLYTAVCQCYFDCQAGVHGEVFARRALSKISELSQLEHMSDSSYNEETQKAFRESTLKMAVMIFKRAVFESRRKPKGILRPKLKNNLKDAEKLPWPRTSTERLLVEMFGNNAAQFLAILEALTDSNRRILQAGPPVPDEPEIHDVIAELCFAGIDILSGGGNKGERNMRSTPQSELCKLLKDSSLLELAVQEKDAVSAEAVVKFSKLAFSYEHWEAFDAIIAPLYSFLQDKENKKWKKEEMDLRILIAAQPLLSGKKHKHNVQIHVKQNHMAEFPNYLEMIGLQGEPIDSKSSDDHITLAETLYSCVCSCSQDVQPDRDIVIDVILFLWQKCKVGVQRMQTGLDGSKFVQKCEMNSKWIYILCLIYEVMQRSSFIHTDALILGEAALRLAGIAESMADAIMKWGKKSDRSHEKVNADVRTGRHKPLSMKKTPLTQLSFAYETLDKAVRGLSVSRSEGIRHHEESLFDHYIRMLGAKRQHVENTLKVQSSSSKPLVNNAMMMDLQLELIVAQLRVSIKILRQVKADGEHLRSSKSCKKIQGRDESLHFRTEAEILDKINKNKLSKAIFLMQKAVLFNTGLDCSPSMLLEDSEKLIQQAEIEENAVYLSCIKQTETKGVKMNVPPPPILLCKTENSMVFKPAPFTSDTKVAWYCLFGRSVTGPNLKVRLNDHNLLGTGEQIPANGNISLEVKDLNTNEKYIFAVAAYAADGRLIGDVIGESTKPILASLPLSVPATFAYLAQSAYHTGYYKMAKKACSVLWNYFVSSPSLAEQNNSETRGSPDSHITQMRLWNEAVANSSPILLQLFLGSIFILDDINIKEGALFCDSVCDGELSRKGQICRLAECERLLVALDVSTLLSDTSYALQAVVQCYGLIAPLIYHRIPSVAVVQILMKCLAVLQEIPSSTWQKKQAGVAEGVLHMTACIVYYVAKALRSWEEYELALCVIETGKKLLSLPDNTSLTISNSQAKSNCDDIEKADDKEKGYFPKKHQKKKSVIGDKVNEQLNAIEQNLLKLTKPFNGAMLTGQEDPVLLYSVVSCWSPSAAFKEIMKFKKKSRFLEFLVQLLQRVYYEEKFLKVLEWSSSALDYLKRRNDNIFGNKQTDETGDVPAPQDSFRRYTTALVEYQKDLGASTLKQAKKQNLPKKVESVTHQKNKNRNVEPHRLTREEAEKKAFTTLLVLLTPIVGRYMKRKRLFQASREEMPWRAQMNLLLALTHFSLFKKKLSQLYSEELESEQSANSYGVLDPELFTLHHAGTVVMATETNAADEQMSSLGHLHSSLKLDLPPDAKLTDSSEPSTKRSDMDTPRTQMTNDTETSSPPLKEQAKLNMSSVVLLDHLGKIFIHLKRALVLAHRGGHWTLLQNAGRVLWNLVLEIQLITKQFDAKKGFFPIRKDHLNNEIWMPFFFAADTILDMLVILQNTGSVQVIDESGKFSVPSCMGSIADDEGGSNLRFDYPFDDVNVIDMRWICDLVMKAMEVLYFVKRWEALVHIAVQFNILSHERFTEQITPLLVPAQRMLAGSIFHIRGTDVSEMNSNAPAEESDEKMHCRNYIGKQLHVSTISNKARNSGADFDQRGHIVHSDSKVLTCVPLDVLDTFSCFRESLQKSKYSSRALRHSRKLLTLFLAYSQGLNSQDKHTSPQLSYGKVGFSNGALQAYRPVPPDLSEEEFISVCSIESKAIPPSHLSIVIASYDKTIEILHSDRQQGLKAQALHELGNLHLYAGNKRAAFKCWCQALDETLNMSDALNSWQELDSSPDSISNGRSKDYSEKFLSRAGIWGCLLAAVIAAKMSRYILTSDVRKRTDCCLLSALLFKSLFRVSLPHPDEDLDYALYEIGEGCEITELIPGIDLFSDRHRADVITVVSSLGFLISELHSVAQNLMVLPLFTLYQYLVSIICRDPVKSVEGRLLKVKVLTDLHLFSEAFHEYFLLNSGKRIPRRPHEGFSSAVKVLATLKFLPSKTLLSSENLQALEEILNRKPSPCLLSVCDQATMNKLVLTKTHFILKLSSTINAIPEVSKEPGYYVTGDRTKQQSENQEPTLLEDKGESDAPIQLASKQDLTLSKLKDMLLKEAEERVKYILQNVGKKYNHLSECTAVDLEMAIEAKLQLSEIAQQRQHIAESIAFSFSALKILQEAKLFTTKAKHDRKDGQIRQEIVKEESSTHPTESEARERLGMNTWLRCRIALVTILTRQICGIALYDQDTLDGSALITAGIVEAETLNDSETQARFMLQAVFLDIQEGRPRKGVQLMLKNIINLLQEKCFMSPVAYLTLAQSLILSADLMENNEDQQLFWTKQLNNYKLAHELIIKQLVRLGETIEHNLTPSVVSSSWPSLNNIYLPQICLLAKVQMRIGRILTLQANSLSVSSVKPSYILPSFNLFTMALELCRLSAFRQRDLEAELLFLKGQTERLMFVLGDHEKSCAVKSFSEAINISLDTDQNFSLMRKCYLEIALVYLHMSSLDSNKTSTIPLCAPKTTSKRKGEKVTEKDYGAKTVSLSELYKLLAWIAVRAATQVADATIAYKQLIGEMDVIEQATNAQLHQHIPTFACMDLLATYKKYFQDCCPTLDQHNCAVKQEPAYESPTDGKKRGGDSLPVDTLSWVHIIRYHNHLMRLKNLLTMTDFDDGKMFASDTLYTSVFDNGITVRYVEMHLFLKKHLYSYSTCCVNDFPAELLWGLEPKTTSFYTPSKATLESKDSHQHKPEPLKSPSSGSLQSKLVPQEQIVTHAVDQELCLQWYFPTLERSTLEKPMVLLMYAFNKQNIDVKDPRKCDPSAVLCGYLWASLAHVLSLHEKLCNLRQKAEISMHNVSDTSIPSSSEKQKRPAQTTTSKPDPKALKITEELQAMVLQCCSEAQALLTTDPDPQPITQAPFDITLPSLISLERVFDLTHGCMLMKGGLLDWTMSQLT
ncbi:cilia- and flagella-associated protein 54 [Hyla sarda]|uniref:cilia- and flagella-associated protein 54 n=1 Tax=Hyla sarda TaxID=327740 RepID=UPI0024C32458|nr:cilia- and flagella-associated protein 54 [Hyla sarda]